MLKIDNELKKKEFEDSLTNITNQLYALKVDNDEKVEKKEEIRARGKPYKTIELNLESRLRKTGYHFKVLKIEYYESGLYIYIDVEGNGTLGPIPNPKYSRLNGHPLVIRSFYRAEINEPNHQKGYIKIFPRHFNMLGTGKDLIFSFGKSECPYPDLNLGPLTPNNR